MPMPLRDEFLQSCKPDTEIREATGATLNIMEYGSYRVENRLFVDMWFLIDAATAGEQLRRQAT